MPSLDEKIVQLSSEDYIKILGSVDTLVDNGYIDPSLKRKATEKFVDDKLAEYTNKHK